MAIPTKDALLVPYSANFATRLTTDPAIYHVILATAASFATLADNYSTSVDNLTASRADGTQSKALTASRDESKGLLLASARQLYAQIQLDTGISDANKILIGVTPRAGSYSPIPAPTDRPEMDLVSVVGRKVNIRVHGAGAVKPRRPKDCVAAWVYSFVGTTYPSNPSEWTYCGSTSKPDFSVDFPDAADGAQVFICAAWINAKQQAGPASLPITTHLQYGGVQSTTIKIAA